MTDDYFEGKKVLITGGAGSIGSEIAKALLKKKVKVVRVLDIDEEGLFKLSHELFPDERVRFLVGDVREKERVKRAMEDIDIVFHAAALKHVPSCEYNPFEAVKTNVVGTQNALEAAIDEEVEKFITISTDKAVNPISVMGATKLLAERLTISANYYKGPRKTKFSCVRFGNVLGSSGSVVEIFIEQLKKGKPLTITDPRMTRFVMTMRHAVECILKATQMAQGGEIFIFKMPTVELGELAAAIAEELSQKLGLEKIEMRTIGVRPGEKFHEELMTEEESVWAEETPEMFIIKPLVELSDGIVREYSFLNEEYFSSRKRRLVSKDATPRLTREEIKKLLRECIIL
ncbi:MAG: SDR family NAD(P)-dependent oxidoreductase [Candidatus Hadarchaeales archaeon]